MRRSTAPHIGSTTTRACTKVTSAFRALRRGGDPRRRARRSATTPRTAVTESYKPMLATASAEPSAVRPRAPRSADSGGRERASRVVRDRGHRGVRGAPLRLPPRAPRTHRLLRREALTVEAEVPEEEQCSTYCGRKTAAIQDGQPDGVLS